MSVIVVVRKNGQAVIAADTQASDNSVIVRADYVKNHEKIIAHGGNFLGFAGWSASQEIMESVVRHHAESLDFSDRAAIFETSRKLHGLLKSDYFLETQEDKDQPVESSQVSMLVAGPKGIFELESYRAVTEYTRFWAIGSGRSLAIGAMHAIYNQLDDPLQIARAGVAAACEFDEGCALPMTHHSIALAAESKTS